MHHNNIINDSLAQLAEHWIPDPKVVGSSPAWVNILFTIHPFKKILDNFK
jgi:hypothetical protein